MFVENSCPLLLKTASSIIAVILVVCSPYYGDNQRNEQTNGRYNKENQCGIIVRILNSRLN